MALPSYTTDLTTYNDCTNATGWVELQGMSAGAPPDIDSDLAIHGSICITSDRSKVGLSSNAFVGAGITLGIDEAIFVWSKFLAPNSTATLALGGIRVMVGDSDTVYDGYYMDGADTYAYGGWKNYVVDPTTTPDQLVGTTTGLYSTVGMGWNLPLQAPAKGNPYATDIIRYGRGASIFTGGELGDYATFYGYSLVNDNPTTGRFGLVQYNTELLSYLFKGLMSLGTTATPVDMRDSNVDMVIANTTKVLSSFNRIEVHNVASYVEWTSVSIKSTCLVSRGQFEMIDNATVIDNGGVFTSLDTFIYQSNAIITGRTYRDCNTVTQGGATMTNGSVDKPFGLVGMLVSNLNLVTDYTFNSTGTGHAVDLGTFTADTSVSWDNKDFDYALTNGATGNETILVSVDATFTLTINVVSGATVPTVYNTGLGTVNVVSGLVTLTITGHVVGSSVVIYDLDAIDPQELGTRLATFDNALATVQYQYTGSKSGDDVQIKAIESGYKVYSQPLVLPISDSTYTIQQETETN